MLDILTSCQLAALLDHIDGIVAHQRLTLYCCKSSVCHCLVSEQCIVIYSGKMWQKQPSPLFIEIDLFPLLLIQPSLF